MCTERTTAQESLEAMQLKLCLFFVLSRWLDAYILLHLAYEYDRRNMKPSQHITQFYVHVDSQRADHLLEMEPLAGARRTILICCSLHLVFRRRYSVRSLWNNMAQEEWVLKINTISLQVLNFKKMRWFLWMDIWTCVYLSLPFYVVSIIMEYFIHDSIFGKFSLARIFGKFFQKPDRSHFFVTSLFIAMMKKNLRSVGLINSAVELIGVQLLDYVWRSKVLFGFFSVNKQDKFSKKLPIRTTRLHQRSR